MLYLLERYNDRHDTEGLPGLLSSLMTEFPKYRDGMPADPALGTDRQAALTRVPQVDWDLLDARSSLELVTPFLEQEYTTWGWTFPKSSMNFCHS